MAFKLFVTFINQDFAPRRMAAFDPERTFGAACSLQKLRSGEIGSGDLATRFKLRGIVQPYL